MHKQLVDCAAGRIPADLVLRNGRIVHVFTGEIARGDIAVINGYIAGVDEHGKLGIGELDARGVRDRPPVEAVERRRGARRFRRPQAAGALRRIGGAAPQLPACQL